MTRDKFKVIDSYKKQQTAQVLYARGALIESCSYAPEICDLQVCRPFQMSTAPWAARKRQQVMPYKKG